MTPRSILLPVFLIGLLAAQTGHAATGANRSCEELIPAGAMPVGEMFLCGNGGGRMEDQFACRDYRADGRIYRLLLRGGAIPREAYALASPNTPSERLRVNGQSCGQPRPRALPQTACFRGAGVCKDEKGNALPCGVYAAYAGNEKGDAVHYLVYYEPDGSGIRRVDTILGTHTNAAFEAELAFALGAAQRDTDPARARTYIAHAAVLAPGEPRYRSSQTENRSVAADASDSNNPQGPTSLCTLH